MKKETFKDFMVPGRKVRIDVYNWYGNLVDVVDETIESVEVYDVCENIVEEPSKWEGWMDCHVETDEGVYDNCWLDCFAPIHTLSDCDEDDFKKIFHEVTFGSLYISDYSNTLNVDEYEVSDICDGYSDEVAEEHPDDWADYLTEDGFAEYCMDYVCNMQY